MATATASPGAGSSELQQNFARNHVSKSIPPKGYIIARRVSDMKFLVARFKQLMSLQVSTHPKDTLLQLTKIEMAPSSKLYIQAAARAGLNLRDGGERL